MSCDCNGNCQSGSNEIDNDTHLRLETLYRVFGYLENINNNLGTPWIPSNEWIVEFSDGLVNYVKFGLSSEQKDSIKKREEKRIKKENRTKEIERLQQEIRRLENE